MALEAASSIFFSNCRLHSVNKSLRFGISCSPPALNFNLLYNLPPLSSSSPPTRKPAFQLHSAVESLTVEEAEEEEEEGEEEVGSSGKGDSRRKLFVLNLPWSFSVADIKKVFSECGSVADVEIIKQKNGKSRGFAFVTMASGEEAQLAIEKFDSYELVGRIIRVQFAKKFKRPARTIPEGPPPTPGETRYKLYVSNLAWKVRSSNLREFFSPDFNPISARVIFGGTSRKSAGYGFVSFLTKEEAESAVSALDGKELLGRAVKLKFSENRPAASRSKQESSSGTIESKDESSSDASESNQESSPVALESKDESSSVVSESNQESSSVVSESKQESDEQGS